MNPPHWEAVDGDDVFRFRDSCLVYAVRGPEGTVLIDAGTGASAAHLDSAATPLGPITVLLTHHLRDHSDGAIRLHAEANATILGNELDADYYVDPEQHFRERTVWNSYDNRWDRFAPIRRLPIDGWMRDYETRRIAGLDWDVIPTPGHTNGASSYVVTLPNGRRLAFVGETICGPDGRTSRVAPLQYNYNDLDGAVNLWRSCQRLLDARPDRIFPSVGVPIDDPARAVAAFGENLRGIDGIHPGFAARITPPRPPEDEIEEVLPRLWRSVDSFANTHFVLSRDRRRVLAIDYGYSETAARMPSASHRSTRRPLLHGLNGLNARFGIERIETILISHYHDDHVCGVPLLQRLHGSDVWAADHFADILERPARYDRPCLWHQPIPLARRLPCGETILWDDDVAITLHPMSGHTRFSTLICLSIDGVRVAHTGDQIFFQPWEFGPDARLFTNHVYKNGLDLGCYAETVAHLAEFRPEIVLTGHTKPYRPTDDWLSILTRGATAFDAVHRALMPLGDDDVHFGPESQAGKLAPYHAHRAEPDDAPLRFDGWILNPFPTPQTATVRLIAPDDAWTSEAVSVALEPRGRADFSIALTPPSPETRCRRQPIALELTVGGRPFGQIAEALVTLGFPFF